MALQGVIPNPFRINADIETAYAKVVRMQFNVLQKTVELHVYIYNSVEDRDGDNPATPVSNAVFVVSGEEYTQYFSDELLAEAGVTSLGQAYAYIKTQDQFAEWIDC